MNKNPRPARRGIIREGLQQDFRASCANCDWATEHPMAASHVTAHVRLTGHTAHLQTRAVWLYSPANPVASSTEGAPHGL